MNDEDNTTTNLGENGANVQHANFASGGSKPQTVLLFGKPIKKGLIFGVAGGVVGLVAIIIIFCTFFSGPSKDDYKAMLHEAGHLQSRDSINSMDVNYVEHNLIKLRDADKYLPNNDEVIGRMKKSKTLKDPDVRRMFDDYVKAHEILKPRVQRVAEYGRMFYKINQACSDRLGYVYYSLADGDEIGKKYDENRAECKKLLEEYKSSDDKLVSDYATAKLKYVGEMRQYQIDYKKYLSNILRNSSPAHVQEPEKEEKAFKEIIDDSDPSSVTGSNSYPLEQLLKSKIGPKDRNY